MVIHLVRRQQPEQLAEQRRILLFPHRQPQLGAHQLGVVQHQLVLVLGQGRRERVAIHMAGQRLCQLLQVPVSDRRLLIQRIATIRIRVVADEVRHIGVDETVGAVIQGQPEQGHVVGVHHPVTEPRRLPLGDEPRGAAHYFGKQLGAIGQLGEVVTPRIVDEGGDLLPLPAPGEILEMTEAQMARRGAQHGRPALHLLPVDRLVTAQQHQSPGGGNAEGMQRLGSQVLANAGSQHGTAVAKAGEWRLARPFQVQVPAAAIRRQLLPQQQGAAIPEARAVTTELVARIDLGHRLHARQGLPLAATSEPLRLAHLPEPQLTKQRTVQMQQSGAMQRLRGNRLASPGEFGGKSVDQLHGDGGCPCVCSCHSLYRRRLVEANRRSRLFISRRRRCKSGSIPCPCWRLPGAIRPRRPT